jgi:formylglycine-generating enzyme required for sulfatase activity
VFLLGSRVYRPFGPDFDPVPEQLVHVSPFFLEVDELTVADFRALGPLDADPPLTTGDDPRCEYAPEAGGREGASLNCVSRATAEAACAARGRRLPTEAEWEFAAGSRTLESPLPWWPFADTSNEAICAQAVLARASLAESIAEEPLSQFCIAFEPDLPDGPQLGGDPSDLSPLGLRNLGGNLSEWVADAHARYSDPICWGPDLELREDPCCRADEVSAVLRGGSWASIPYNAHVTFRREAGRGLQVSHVGFRCAESAR